MKKKKKLDAMMDEMADIFKKIMKKKSAATVIIKAMTVTDDEGFRQKLKDKLVQLALDLD